MTGSRYVLLGLAPARAEWFRVVGQWANTGMLPVEFVKCLSAEEVRARLTGGRPFSALLVDAAVTALDRDLVDVARGSGCAVLVVDEARRGRDWAALGAVATLSPHFDRKELLDSLAGFVSQITRADCAPEPDDAAVAGGWRAPLVAVTGPGGTGSSTVAIALAQGLAADVRAGGAVLLADFCHRAEMAMLHDARDVVPGVQELVEACRTGHPTAADVRTMTFDVPERGYHLLLGLRQRHAWPSIRPRAFAAGLDALRTTFRYVVADVDADTEGEEDGGSIDVEERNVMARSTLAAADAVLVVGVAGMKGTHSCAAVVASLLAFGVPGHRIITVLNRAPRAAGRRGEIGQCLEELLPEGAAATLQAPVFLPERHVDDALRDSVRLPEPLVAPLVSSFRLLTDGAVANDKRAARPRLLRPGALGRWTPELEPR